MKAGWSEVRLGDYITDIAAGPFGSKLKVECFVESGFPIIDGANLKGFRVTDNITKYVTNEKARSLHRSIAKRNDVIVTISGTVGQIAYIPTNSEYEEYLCSQRQFRVSFDEGKVHVPYLVYYFHSFLGQRKILSFANQVGVPALAQPLKNFREIRLSLPPLLVQKRIASVLGALDDKIELNRKMNKNLEEQAQALFKSWFVDFEPWGGKMPKEWKMCTLGDVSKNVRERVGSQERVVLSAVAAGKLVQSEEYFTKKVFSADIRKYIVVDENDFAYNPSRINIGSIGVNDLGVKGCVSPVYVCVRFANEYENYFRFFIKSEQFRDEAKVRAIGSVRQSLNYSDFALIECCYPTIKDVRSFNKVYCNLYHLQMSIENESRKLAETRDALLPKLMSGEIEV